MMDWIFYLIVFLVLFTFVAILLTVRYFIDKRLEKFEKKQQMEEEAWQTAESNSGL
jgi:hypothetical protein